jgi:Ca2+-binding RTX toxin-like protein
LIYGDSDDPNYTGGAGDTIDGGTGDDYCYGGPGDDDMTGGTGIDNLLGEDGNDTFHVNDGVQDIVGGGNGTDTCRLSLGQRDSNDLLTSIEVYS